MANGPPAAFDMYQVPTFLGPLLNVFDDADEQWRQFKNLRASISSLRSQEVIAAAGGRKHLEGAAHEHWWPKGDVRESTLMSNIELAYRKSLLELEIDMNVGVLTPTRADMLVCKVVRLLEARKLRLKRKWRKKKG